MGTDKVVFAEVVRDGATGSDRVRMLNRYILYYYYHRAWPIGLPEVTWPEGVPLGARMRNWVSRVFFLL
jgi:hypothetical protein